MKARRSFISLHRYWIWANRLRQYYFAAIDRRTSSDETMWADDIGLFMSHWYGSLYVVIDGYRRMGLHDPTIDTLLKSPNIALLKQFRDATFHFRPKYYDKKFTDFWKASDCTVPWVRAVNKRFGEFFLRTLRENIETHRSPNHRPTRLRRAAEPERSAKQKER